MSDSVCVATVLSRKSSIPWTLSLLQPSAAQFDPAREVEQRLMDKSSQRSPEKSVQRGDSQANFPSDLTRPF